jgi:2-keto-3-deoxy-L-fuconate dehydrogenase
VHAVDIDEAALASLEGCDAHRCDLTDGAAIRALADAVGPVDVLFNCAGMVHNGTILECDEAAWETSQALNVTRCTDMIRAFLPGMLARAGDRSSTWRRSPAR